MAPLIRPFTPDDYSDLSAVWNAAHPEMPFTADEWRTKDEQHDPARASAQFVAECAGDAVGYGAYYQYAASEPRKFWLLLAVPPEHRGEGIGKALYDHLMSTLAAFDPILLQAKVWEHRPLSARFLKDRGFGEILRDWELRLDVAAFDPAPYTDLERKLCGQGARIRTLEELGADPDRDYKLYLLNRLIKEDMPDSDHQPPPDFDRFRESLADPNRPPEAYFVAVQENEYVGLSSLWRTRMDNELFTGLTGVKRAYRRRGIALALKLRGLAYAGVGGHPTIRTRNATTNAGMLALNQRLGFVKGPARITFVKILGER